MSTKSNRIDWSAVKQRLKASEAALERALVVDPARIQEVYHQRALDLADRQKAEAAARGVQFPVLVFSLGTERYGLELAALVEVFPFAKCAAVPTGPAELLGVINVRGEIHSVVDLTRMLELPEAAERAAGYVAIVRLNGLEVGVRVDQVERMELVSPETLQDPAQAQGLPTRYLKGIAPDNLLLLSTEALLSHTVFKDVA